jgi:hypothetical protein
LGIVVSSSVMILVKDNKKAFYLGLFICLLGFILSLIAVIGLQVNFLNGFWFMVLVGLGLYLPYVVVHTTIFERLLAMTREKGNCGYLMYLADAIGYLGYVAVIISNSFVSKQISVLNLFVIMVASISVISCVLVVFAWIYFVKKVGNTAT